jgi:putative DNA primase/helicase
MEGKVMIAVPPKETPQVKDNGLVDKAIKLRTESNLCMIASGKLKIDEKTGERKLKSPYPDWAIYNQPGAALPTIEQMWEWDRTYHSTLWGMVTGPISGIVVFDADTPETIALMDDSGLTAHVITKRGKHYYFPYLGSKYDNLIYTKTGIIPHVDIRARGGFVNCLGNNENASYEMAVIPQKDNLNDYKKLPDDIKQAISRLQANINNGDPKEPIGDKITSGNRNHSLARIAGALRRLGMTQEQIEANLLSTNKQMCDPPLPDSEVLTIAKSISRYEPGARNDKIEIHDFDNNLTDTANGEYFTRQYKDYLRYDHRRARWLKFEGQFYIEDVDGHVYRLGIMAIRNRYKESVNITDLKERSKVAAWCIQSEQRSRLDAMIKIAQSLEPLADSGIDFDSNQWLLAVKNGIIDLKTGILRDGRPEDRITQHSDIVYRTDAPKPGRFIQFLNEVFNNDQELIDWMLRALGYNLTGCTIEQIIFILFGAGANGKSILLAILRYVLGDYAYNAPFSTFELDARASIPNDLAALERRRFITSLETLDGKHFNESRIKALSGEDDVTARYLNHEFFTFKPVGKLWLGVNHKPSRALKYQPKTVS